MSLSTHEIGAVSELIVAGYLASQGHQVMWAVSGASRADLIYVKNSKPVKVQVKTTGWNKFGGPFHYEQCRLNTTAHRSGYSLDEIDEMWVVGTHLWCFPIEIVQGKVCLSLGTNNPNPRCRYKCNGYIADDFIVVRGSVERPYRARLTFNEATVSDA